MHRHIISIVVLALALTSCRSLGRPVSSPLPDDPWLALAYSPALIGTPPWEVRITREGRVFLQAIKYAGASRSAQTYEQNRLSTSQLKSLDMVLEQARLDELQTDYEFGGTDQETLRVWFNGSYRAAVRVYGPGRGCDRAEIQRFLRVWNAAVRLVVVPTMRYTNHIYTRCFESDTPGGIRLGRVLPPESQSPRCSRRAARAQTYVRTNKGFESRLQQARSGASDVRLSTPRRSYRRRIPHTRRSSRS